MIIFIVASVLLTVMAVALLIYGSNSSKVKFEDDEVASKTIDLQNRIKEIEQDLRNERIQASEAEIALTEIHQAQVKLTSKDETHAASQKSPVSFGNFLKYAIIITIPLFTLATYFVVGAPELINPDTSQLVQSTAKTTPLDLDQAVTTLQQQIDKDPDDKRARELLFRTLMTLKRFDEALVIIRATIEHQSQSAELLVMEAEALMLSQQGVVTPKVANLAKRVLTMDANQSTALWLVGLHNFLIGQYTDAADYFTNAANVSDDEGRQNFLKALASESQKLTKLIAENDNPSLQVIFVIDESVADQIKTADVMEIFVEKTDQEFSTFTARQIPLGNNLEFNLVLDEAVAIAQSASGSFDQVKVFARVSSGKEAFSKNYKLKGKLDSVAIFDGTTYHLTIGHSNN